MISLYGSNENGNGNGNGHNGNGNGRKKSFLWRRSRNTEPDLTAYRRLALQLHFDLSGPDQVRSALVVTPGGGNRSAHAAASLARCLGDQLRKPVLLVDSCPVGDNVSALMECSANHGFVDMLTGPENSLAQLVVPTSSDYVHFLPAGSLPVSADRVPPERLQMFLEEAQAKYEFVLLAGGDVLHDPLALAMAPMAGCVMLVVFENESKIDDLDMAQSSLRICGARKVGLIWAAAGGSR